MGLDAGFKAYVAAAFPSAIVSDDALAAAGPPYALLLDAMCSLHAWRPADKLAPPRVSELADYLWRACARGASSETSVVVAFDQQAHTPRPKAIEHGKRKVCAAPMGAAAVAAALADDRLPGDTWDEALADRGARAAVAEALARALVERFLERGAFRKLIVHGAWPAARAFKRNGGAARDCPRSAEAALLGEGEVAAAYWAIRMARRAGGAPVVLRSVDTDLALIAALHAAPGVLVQLHHFDRKTRAVVNTTIDARALAQHVPAALGIPLADWAVVCIARGTDFVGRAARGLPAWDKYVAACANVLQGTSKPLWRRDRAALDADLLARALRAAAAANGNRGGAPEFDQAWMRRVLWNAAYWELAPLGLGARVDPLRSVRGWDVDSDGAVVEASAAFRGGVEELRSE